MAAESEWPFEDSPNVAVITVQPILDGDSWIALVTHDEDDGCWQFHGPAGAHVDDARLVALKEMVALDSSIQQLADLDFGWRAWRPTPDAPWQRGPK